MIKFKFITCKNPEYIEERYLRAKVLREHLGLPTGCEVFPFEKEALHLVAINNENEVIGCVMFNPEEQGGRLLQMAIYKEYQNKGIGTMMIKELEKHLKTIGIKNIYLHARFNAVQFYEKLGYTIEGNEFEEVGIKHFNMIKFLA